MSVLSIVPLFSSLATGQRLCRQYLLLCCLLCCTVAPLSYAVEAAADFSVPININTADTQALAAALSGIGSSRAAAIVEYRETYGPFKSIDELTAIKGIGQKFIERNRERMTLQ